MVGEYRPPVDLTVAVIGAGVVGRMRASVVKKNPNTRLLAVADLDQEAARQVAEPLGAEAVSDYRHLLERTELGAVVVATPTHTHFQMVEDALLADKHVLCEKPLAPTLEQCQRLESLARERGLTLAVGFNHRYYPCIKILKENLSQVGPVEHVRALCGHQGLGEFRADWNYQAAFSGGGVMMDLGIHLTDLVGYLFGPVEKVYGTASNSLWEVEGSEDHAAAHLTTSLGIPVSYHATWGEWKGYRLILEVYGREGLARAFYAPMLNLFVPRGEGRPSNRWNLHPWVNVREKVFGWETTATLAFQEEWRDFLGALDGRWGDLADAAAGVHSVAVADAVWRSQRSGEPVVLGR